MFAIKLNSQAVNVVTLPLRLAILVVFAGCASCEDNDEYLVPSVPPPEGAVYGAVELRTHALVNEHRATLSRVALIWSDCIASIARQHSFNMATGLVPFGHDGFYARGDTISVRCVAQNASAENVARPGRGDDPALAALTMWLNSSGHTANIEGNYTHTGVGVARSSDSTWYFTQIFVRAR